VRTAQQQSSIVFAAEAVFIASRRRWTAPGNAVFHFSPGEQVVEPSLLDEQMVLARLQTKEGSPQPSIASSLSISRDNKTAIELVVAGVRGWEAGLRRQMDDRSH